MKIELPATTAIGYRRTAGAYMGTLAIHPAFIRPPPCHMIYHITPDSELAIRLDDLELYLQYQILFIVSPNGIFIPITPLITNNPDTANHQIAAPMRMAEHPGLYHIFTLPTPISATFQYPRTER
ncbi:hypothetical protein TWF679_005414 [Orbilia oligospora]|uniref:Uncharacterized protein n=1 Tax=Orbilia oligospora TaxID=2813651 RepID=A0A8H8VC16_ORBOL|nr:hypothetical protein TWF679_005414 [Orbilia oligospora]